MSGKWGKHKGKRPLETTLGSAPKDVADLSHLRKPITTSIHGLKEVLALFQTATSEVQDYVTYECDVLYECRICRSIFRSIANFILHKRNYCRCKFNQAGGYGGGGFVIGESVKTSDEEEEGDESAKKAILPIVDKLLKKQEINILAAKTLNEDLSQKNENSDEDVVFVSEVNNVVLQKIDDSKVAVYQTAVKDVEKVASPKLMKSEVMEIHDILEHKEAVLDVDGKISQKKTSRSNVPKQELACSVCGAVFSTEKTLTHHIKFKHNKSCMVYQCPDCKVTFSNPWNVYRHLYKIHKRTSSQVRRMRPQVHAGKIRKDLEPEKRRPKDPVQENAENQWMNNFEDDKDFQMCGGCGKRFERRAALHSHSQMCTKRIAVCNTIKETQRVKPQEKSKPKVEKADGAKGAARRKAKPTIFHRVKEDDDKPEIFTISDDDSDVEMTPAATPPSGAFKECLNDEFDQCFVTTALPYVAADELKCVPCQTRYRSAHRLLWHMSLHFSWFRFQCARCAFVSFNRYDCTSHAYVRHGTPTHLIGSIVLPIPKWKVLSVSHKFAALAGETEMPRLEAAQNGAETIVLEDDDMPDICGENGEAAPSDEEKEKEEKAGPSKVSRPIRNRTRSVKTVQNDFIYDLAKVLKFDGSERNPKMKKAASKQ